MIYEPEDGMGSETPQRLMELKNGKLWMAAGSHSTSWIEIGGKIYYAGDKINDMLEPRWRHLAGNQQWRTSIHQ